MKVNINKQVEKPRTVAIDDIPDGSVVIADPVRDRFHAGYGDVLLLKYNGITVGIDLDKDAPSRSWGAGTGDSKTSLYADPVYYRIKSIELEEI